MNRILLRVVAIVLVVIVAPTLPAQHVLKDGGNPIPIGFNYRSMVSREADGVVRSANFPVVTKVDSGSAPHVAGLARGDLIVEVNGTDGREAGLFRDRTPGTRYSLRVRRGAETLTVEWVVPVPPATPGPGR